MRAVAPTIAILFFAAASAAPAATIHVPGDQPTIQAAINVASSGDTVLVAPGTYEPAFTHSVAELTLKSEAGPDQTVIDGTGNSVCFQANNTNLLIEGLQFIGAHETGYG